MMFYDALKLVCSGHELTRTAWASSRMIFLETIETESPDDGSERFEILTYAGSSPADPNRFPYEPTPHDLMSQDWELVR